MAIKAEWRFDARLRQGGVKTMAMKHSTHRQLQTVHLADGLITEAKLGSLAVTTAKIATSGVITSKIADGAATAGKIGALAVTSAKIGTSQVITSKIADLNVTSGKIATSGVITSKIADGAATAGKIGALAVTSAKIGTSQVITSKIADLNVTSGKIATSGVVTTKIADGAATADKLGALAVTSAKIGTSQVITSKIADLNVTSGKIATSGVVTTKIADSNVTLLKLAAAARRQTMVLRMEGVANGDELLGGNSTTGFTFVSSVRIANAQLIWEGSTSSAQMKATLYKNASSICVLGVASASPGKKIFTAVATSAQMTANTLQSTDRFRAAVTAGNEVKQSAGPPVLRIQYEQLA